MGPGRYAATLLRRGAGQARRKPSSRLPAPTRPVGRSPGNSLRSRRTAAALHRPGAGTGRTACGVDGAVDFLYRPSGRLPDRAVVIGRAGCGGGVGRVVPRGGALKEDVDEGSHPACRRLGTVLRLGAGLPPYEDPVVVRSGPLARALQGLNVPDKPSSTREPAGRGAGGVDLDGRIAGGEATHLSGSCSCVHNPR